MVPQLHLPLFSFPTGPGTADDTCERRRSGSRDDAGMFSSGNRGGGFAAQSSNPFAQSQGSSTMNQFQSNANAPVAQTAFGQSSGFINQPPLPPGGMAGAPGRGFGHQPPLPPGGMAGAPSGGFGATSTGGNPFGQKKTNNNNNNKAHNSAGTTFGQNSVSTSSTLPGAHTTFGFSSSTGGKPKNRETGYSGNAPKTAFGGNGSASFGGSSAAFGGNDNGFGAGQTTFGASAPRRGQRSFSQDANGFGSGGTAAPAPLSSPGAGQTTFGAPTPKRGQGSFSQNSNGFGSGRTAAPAPVSTPGTSFGSQASGARVRKKQITPNTASSSLSDNHFATAGNGRGAPNAPAIHTSFGGAAGSNSSRSPAFGKPSPAGSPPATTFGGVTDKRRQTTPTFGSDVSAGGFGNSDKMVSMEARMSGAKKSPFQKGKQAGVSGERDANPFVGQQSKSSRNFPAGGDAFGAAKAPKVSPTNEKHGKQRQSRPKKKTPSTSDEDTSYAPMPSAASTEESSKAELSAATNLNGLCADMCSPAERELHIRVDELSVFEKCFPNQPGTERERIIKRFQRSSADHKLDIPEEIRPPGVLRRTQLYIEQEIMDLDQCGEDPRFQQPRVPGPIELYNFCWDRFRMIRKDFVLQNYRGAGGRVHPIALDIHERIARYHVLSEHELIETPSFVAQQNMEQLGQTLKSLNELYDESRKVGDPAYLSPFEAECRAYFILCALDNGRGMDVLKYVKVLPHHILESPHIKFAMRVFVARHTGDYFQFFSLLRQATYLQSCLLFRYIPNARSSALLRMNRAYRSQVYPLEDLVELLCFDDMEHAYSVCQEHGLRIAGRPGTGDDSAVIVKFGGDFETDAQLRRNNTPQKIRSSKIYVGMKQGNYLRRDICRGVTEYARDEYPALSKLIQDSEREEQARLYPNRPAYEDDYSYFVDYNDGAPAAPPASAPPTPSNISVSFGNTQYQPAETDHKKHDLDVIAQRKWELEQKKQAMLERMRELEKAKEEKVRQDQAKKDAVEKAAQSEEHAEKEAVARAQAKKQAEKAKRQQEELEAQLREQKKKRELEEQRRRAEEVAREAEQQRLEALQRAEALRIKAVEDERRRQEEKRQEEIRQKAAEEFERRRQQELAEARARQEREALLEAQRQAQLAKERAERKRVRRAEMQRLAVLKLRLHLWKKYVQDSRTGPGPVAIDAAKLRQVRPHQKAKDSVQWLFRGTNVVSIGTKRLKPAFRSEGDSPLSDTEVSSLWSSEDILGLVCAPLRLVNPGAASIAWKLVIADLLDGASSSFGLWCAVKAGTQDATTPQHDCHRIFQSNQGVDVCCRYLDSTFTQRNGGEVQREKLAATSAVLLPVDLSTLLQAGNSFSWEQRLGDLLSLLRPGCRVSVLVLGFASSEIGSLRSLVTSTLESCVERVQSKFAPQVVHIVVEFVNAGELLPQKFRQVVSKIASLSPPVHNLKSVGLRELLEGSVKAMMNQYESSVGIQSQICAVFPRVREDILSSGVMDLAYPPPELQSVVVDPPHGWNSQEKRHEIRTVLTALEVTFIAIEPSTVQCDQLCDVYFKKIVDFVDRLFRSYPASTAVSTYELKKRIYSLLLPVHERLMQSVDGSANQVTPEEADVLLPWRKIFEEIYETFFETLSDFAIYYPADWRGFNSSVASLLDAVHSPLPTQLHVSSQRPKRDRIVTKQPPVKVSVQSIRRSFGNKSAGSSLSLIDDPLQKYRAVGEMKRLRVEIEKERAASSQFQRMLRQALNQWDD
ncbi:Germinal-center associated nuclear protein [Phytophthora ramorum]|uniref:Germinal-center associated nuclear protein n=1 Tax=Phytophthora ramorum TaxID=164328 RepID=UPI00309ACC6C|nr:Germinal-center associated nuclear protein [Phytophthora ramorum]